MNTNGNVALAQPHIQFVIDQAVRDRKLSNPADKEAAIDEVLPYIRAVRSRIQKREYFDIAMDSLRISDAALRRELWHSIRIVGRWTRARGAGGQPSRTGETDGCGRATTWSCCWLTRTCARDVLPRLEPEDYEDLPTAPIFRALG